jgi:hypothetical protein
MNPVNENEKTNSRSKSELNETNIDEQICLFSKIIIDIFFQTEQSDEKASTELTSNTGATDQQPLRLPKKEKGRRSGCLHPRKQSGAGSKQRKPGGAAQVLR